MKKVTIESISVDLSDWKVNTEEEGIKVWNSDFGDQFCISAAPNRDSSDNIPLMYIKAI